MYQTFLGETFSSKNLAANTLRVCFCLDFLSSLELELALGLTPSTIGVVSVTPLGPLWVASHPPNGQGGDYDHPNFFLKKYNFFSKNNYMTRGDI